MVYPASSSNPWCLDPSEWRLQAFHPASSGSGGLMLLYQFHRRTQNFINLWFWCLAAHKTKLLSFAQQWVSPFILSSCTSSADHDADPRDRRQSRLRNPGLPIVEMCPSSDFQYETKTREKYVLVYIGVYIGAGIGYAGGGVRLWCHWHHHTSLHSLSLIHIWRCRRRG